MSNKPNKAKKNKANITKISANSKQTTTDANKSQITKQTSHIKIKSEQNPHNKNENTTPNNKSIKPKKSFILFRPFIAFGRYLRDSWRELRQVRWPNRKMTWKMTIAVLIYCAIFIVFIVLLDMLFTFIFNLLLS